MSARQLSNSRKKIDPTELGKRRSSDGGGKNSGSVVLQNGSSWCERGFDNETMATSPNSSQRFFDSDGAVQMMTFQPTSRVSKHEESCYQLISSCSTNRSNAVKSGADENTEGLADFPARRASFHTSIQGLSLLRVPDPELTGHINFSDSQAEDTTRMTDEQRNKLERLKQQIFLDNTRRKWGRKLSENKVAKSTHSNVTGETKLPVLTGEAVKRHLRCHETPITVSKPLSMYDSGSNFEPTDRGTPLQNQNYDRDAVFKLARHDSASDQFDAPLNMDPFTSAYYEHHSQRKSNEHDFELSRPPIGEEGDFESIAVFMGRLRTRSEPGDLVSRKVSTVHQLHTRTRSENNELRTKVQLFVKKPLPALPPSTLRVKKQVINEVTSHSISGAHASASWTPRERREGIVNIHTCPNLNVFSDRSWLYQDVSRNRHRYIRGPATPVPPVDFVFREDKS
ncbi:uncharacterized protein LOC111323391 [Stylophora pistillata]|uniref:uncharacterized protein LOC111323391 n=1 Tax=Stylophora pistillata TaxID=50429 RepID=UPI000C053011|nr:uncharacterized protein LOC111323391 [Stylophora pistillata]